MALLVFGERPVDDGEARVLALALPVGMTGGVPPEPLDLLDGEQHAAVRGAGLDLTGRGESCPEPRADTDAAADPLGGDLVAGDAVRAERVQL
ncbi:hypothetical protein Airi02_048820 [Actinoallomurus iriomotensis]|uniref:Uncharacterized protein n=1 Tax=Actinoallomurus iriomotensis TaxID=478107 RepID=A0A9W6S4E2_9ACTN|nr:hypothetical protein Airi02_048820 [Actinoallomurus iriomotensis]